MWSMWPWVSSTAAGVSRFSSRIRRSGPIARCPGSTTIGVRSGPLGQHVAVALQHAGGKSGDQHGSQFPIPAGPLDTGRGARTSLAGKLGPYRPKHGGIPAVPTNEQRRANAKRKLERQMERRATTGTDAPDLVIAVGSAAGGGRDRRRPRSRSSAPSTSTRPAPPPPRRRAPHSPRASTLRTSSAARAGAAVAAVQAAADLGRQLPVPRLRRSRAAKPVKPPRTGKIPTDPAQVSASMTTSQGNIGLHAGQQ